jgi:hypothetical protein
MRRIRRNGERARHTRNGCSDEAAAVDVHDAVSNGQAGYVPATLK